MYFTVNLVPEHQAREAEIYRLQKKVDVTDEFMLRVATDLKEVHTTLQEYIYQVIIIY